MKMLEKDLEKLLKNTAITLTDEEKTEFLNYFDGMSKMLDEFYQFSFPEETEKKEDKNQPVFEGVKPFSGEDLITTNVMPERIQNHSIEIVSHFSR